MNNVLSGLGGMMRQIGASMSNWEAQKKEAQQRALENSLKKQQMDEEAAYRKQSLASQQQQIDDQAADREFGRVSTVAEQMGPNTVLNPEVSALLRKHGYGALITAGKEDAQIPIPNIHGVSAPMTVDMPDRWQGVMPPQLRGQMMTNSRLTDQFGANLEFKLQQLEQQRVLAEMRGDIAGVQAAAALMQAEIAKSKTTQQMTPYQIEQVAREYADSMAPVDAAGERNTAAWTTAFTAKKKELTSNKSGMF